MTVLVLAIGIFLLTGLAISSAAEIWSEWISRMNDEYERRKKCE